MLVVQNENRCFKICDQVYGLLESESRTSSSFGIATAYQDTKMEMGSNDNGFCDRVTSDKKKS